MAKRLDTDEIPPLAEPDDGTAIGEIPQVREWEPGMMDSLSGCQNGLPAGFEPDKYKYFLIPRNRDLVPPLEGTFMAHGYLVKTVRGNHPNIPKTLCPKPTSGIGIGDCEYFHMTHESFRAYNQARRKQSSGGGVSDEDLLEQVFKKIRIDNRPSTHGLPSISDKQPSRRALEVGNMPNNFGMDRDVQVSRIGAKPRSDGKARAKSKGSEK